MPLQALQIIRAGSRISGVTRPNAIVRVDNVSLAPAGPTHSDSLETVVRADARGRFSAVVPGAKEGDRVTVHVGGRIRSSWLTVRLSGIAAIDDRPADISFQGYRLRLRDDGRATLECLRKQLAAGEPGATVRFTNRRTGEKTDIVLDDRGRPPADFAVPAKAGDTFSLHITDGINDLHMRRQTGLMTVVPKDHLAPAIDVLPGGVDAGGPDVRRAVYHGPLIDGSIGLDDPQQGSTGNCWLVAVCSAIAAIDPRRIGDLIKDNGDGTFTVTLKRYDHRARRYVNEKVKVDTELHTTGSDPLYGSSRNSHSPAHMELWWPILEKAYAVWKGSYDAIEWGWGHEAFEALLGAEGQHLDFSASGPERSFDVLRRAIDEDRPVITSTGPDRAAAQERLGLVAGHAYSLVGVREEAGERFVTLRNPWGSFEPAGNGADDGLFELPLDDFYKYFISASVGPSLS